MNSEYQTPPPLSRPSNGGVLEAMPLLELCLSSRFLKEFMALHWRRIFERIERTNEPPQKTDCLSFKSLYTAKPSCEYYRQVYFVHSGLQDEGL